MNPADDLPEEEWVALVREALAMGDAPPRSVSGATSAATASGSSISRRCSKKREKTASV